ncbi:TetR/AcrR family transcriptional regulator [Clostridium tetanomorphum]|uniref:TetR/AcrR family transcriptional regulator n=1 Tax=Clostridium tetanomorphum TaxID=1553 RepID=A0A923EBL3_CLOTT|nr:TetR/AcrR family transcriptional regulator [Clostridium tetanomorphum]MBC2397949.1 TetR/AcrR family transcriptional regulator [Clostridium tetanomorphum]NRZ97130.1 AcrR family transcriptional regulator [Clostridium tetanomorphum]
MFNKDINAKDKIIKVTIDMLNEVGEPDKITIREIAKRAKVGVGLINYHFQTKENLLYRAVSHTMSDMAVQLQKLNDSEDEDPVQRLKIMLKELSDFTVRYSKLSLILASYDLQQGDMQTPLYLIPILREIYKDTKDEIEMRIIALEIIATLQVTYIRSQAFQIYTGIDINNKAQRDELIDIIVNSVINK